MVLTYPFVEITIGIAFLSNTLYGIFIVLACISCFIFHRQCKNNNEYKSSTTVYLVFNYMLIFILTIIWIMSAIICFQPKFMSKERFRWTGFMFSQHMVGYLANIVGDVVMGYRLYIIWEKAKILLYIYGVLVLTAIGMIIVNVWNFIRTQPQQPSKTANTILAVITITSNIVICGLISYKVWSKHRLVRAVGGSRYLLRVLAIIIESSGLYTIWMITWAVTTNIHTSLAVSQALLYGLPHIAGIASMLINVRVGLGWALGEEGRSTYSLPSIPMFRRSEDSISAVHQE